MREVKIIAPVVIVLTLLVYALQEVEYIPNVRDGSWPLLELVDAGGHTAGDVFPTPTPTFTPTVTPYTKTFVSAFTPTVEPTFTPTSTQRGAITYVIKEGDSLFFVAEDHGIDIQDLISFNAAQGVDLTSFLQVGQEIVVPPPDYKVPTLTPTHTSTKIATKTPTMTIPDVYSTLEVKVNCCINYANLRSGPGIMYDTVMQLPPNTKLTALARAHSSTWFRVSDDETGKRGWISITVIGYDFDPMVLPESKNIPATPTSPPPKAQNICQNIGEWTGCGGKPGELICRSDEVGYCQDDLTWTCKRDPAKCTPTETPIAPPSQKEVSDNEDDSGEVEWCYSGFWGEVVCQNETSEIYYDDGSVWSCELIDNEADAPEYAWDCGWQ
jgi:LysM repeat protein